MKNTVLLPLISLWGMQNLQNFMEHLPISFASDFNHKVLSSAARSVSDSAHPVTGSRNFLATVAWFLVVLSRCGGRVTLGAGTGVGNTIRDATWWSVLTDITFESQV